MINESIIYFRVREEGIRCVWNLQLFCKFLKSQCQNKLNRFIICSLIKFLDLKDKKLVVYKYMANMDLQIKRYMVYWQEYRTTVMEERARDHLTLFLLVMKLRTILNAHDPSLTTLRSTHEAKSKYRCVENEVWVAIIE